MTALRTSEQTKISVGITDRQFSTLSDIAFREAGLKITESKRQMIESRIARHLREISCLNFDDYLQSVKNDTNGNLKNDLISVLTTNVSSFFRENHHFETIKNDLMPDLLSRLNKGGSVRFWSAGCSSGQEPYSLAMTLLSAAPQISQFDVKILATDIDRKILARAISGVYTKDEIASVSDDLKHRFVSPHPHKDGTFQVHESLKKLVTFRPLSLLDAWPMRGHFDAILCRNVVIYFDTQTQLTLWPRFHKALRPGGHFFLGHSERIQSPAATGFSPAGVTTYKKISTA